MMSIIILLLLSAFFEALNSPVKADADKASAAATNSAPSSPSIQVPDSASTPSTTDKNNGKNPLDIYMDFTEARGVTVIDHYHAEDGILYIELNEATWDSLDKDHQHRLCDVLAQTDFITKMNVSSAYLTLDKGKTTVGNISYSWFGPHCVFNPNKDYWDYK